jgi:L-alanine-DL-glutamate epimerase-like enolase superfamily enzyme
MLICGFHILVYFLISFAISRLFHGTFYRMAKPTDIIIQDAKLEFLPVETRVPLKFGTETLTSVTCARVEMRVRNVAGHEASGWGETPLSVQWVWPSDIAYSIRHECLKEFCQLLAVEYGGLTGSGHAFELGHDFIFNELPGLLEQFNADQEEAMPWLAALVCASAFDIALHDAFGVANGVPVYETYGFEYMNRDLTSYLEPMEGIADFAGKYPADFLVKSPPEVLAAWHLVGGLDLLDESELTGDEPDDGYPVLLEDWIQRDGLNCLKIKLRGNDAAWDYGRLVRVGEIARRMDVDWLTTDFNCTVTDPVYVNRILDQLLHQHADIYGRILYVEQPFPYELEEHQMNVRSVSARKPLFMDESAHDWRQVRLGWELGWTGVALKTCKTQTGALLSLCWAKAHGMTLMVQDLTNPMLAQVPHVLLAAHAGTIMGVETNGMQFYPEASAREAQIHPGIYQRRNGMVNLSTLTGPGFGYRIDEMPTS